MAGWCARAIEAAAQQHDGGLGAVAEQVAHGVRLAGPWWAEEQDAALEVLAVGGENTAVLRDAEHVLTDPVQEPVREDDVVPRQRRALEEGDPAEPLAVGVAGEGDHLAPEDAELLHELAHLGHQVTGQGILDGQDVE